MARTGSVTAWIEELTTGNRDAVKQLWERYIDRLVRLACTRLKMKKIPRRAADEHDVALSAFYSFCRGAENGRFPKLRDRNDLWPLLVVITMRKAADLAQHHRSQKQGGGKVRGDSALTGGRDASSSVAGIEQVPGREPTPDVVAEIAEEYQRLLDALGEDKLREIAVMKMDGYTDKEVAARLNCGLRTVERKLERIRRILSSVVDKDFIRHPLA